MRKLIVPCLWAIVCLILLGFCFSCSTTEATPEIQITWTLQPFENGEYLKIYSEGYNGCISVMWLDDGGLLHEYKTNYSQRVYIVYTQGGKPTATLSKHPDAIVFSIPKPQGDKQ